MSDNDLRIVPERDETHPRAKPKPTKSNTQQPSKSKTAKARPTRPAVKESPAKTNTPVLIVLSMLVVALAGGCVYLYLGLEDSLKEQASLATRIADIESKLSVTDESLVESGAAIQAVLKGQQEDLELHMSEIRKLWAIAYDRNRVAIEKLQAAEKNQDARLDSASGSIAKFDPLIAEYNGMKSRVETLSSQLLVQSATMDEQSALLRETTDKALALESLVNAQTRSISDHDDAIDAIDEYRIQINQRVRKLEQAQTPAPAPTTP